MLVVGIDAGGTTTRVRLVDEHGRRLASADGAGANVNSSTDAIDALRDVLGAVAADRAVDVLVLGAAGAGAAGRGRAEQALRTAMVGAGLAARIVSVVSDVETAFAAGSTRSVGTVLIAGTGAVAAEMRDFRVARRRDGHGYLLGDRGSAVWIGVAALRAALAAAEGTGPATALHEPVLTALGVRAADDPVQAVLGAVYAGPPAAVGRIAPVVDTVAAEGDAVALGIVDAAVQELLATARAARDGVEPTTPLVLAGGLATSSGLLGHRLRAALGEAIGAEPIVVRDPGVGAVALALRALTDAHPDVDAEAITGVVDALVRAAVE